MQYKPGLDLPYGIFDCLRILKGIANCFRKQVYVTLQNVGKIALAGFYYLQ